MSSSAAVANPVSPAAPPLPARRPELIELRATLASRLATDLRGEHGRVRDDAVNRAEVQRRATEFLTAARPALSEAERAQICREVEHEIFGFGPIQPLLDDPSVTEVMVNRSDRVYVERAGRSERTAIHFDDDAHVRRIIDRIVLPLGRRLDEDNPLVDARLPDGSRVNATIPPVAIDGCNITIRKFPTTSLKAPDLVRFGTLTQHMADFLRACVMARINIVVAGGTGSGKTTLLNVLSDFIPGHERIVTIEDAAELQLAQDQVVRMESKKPNPNGTGGVAIRDLVKNALRMRPERIIVGECRGGEALDMLQAMNTGHDGSMTTLHANTPRDTVSRIETMALMAGIDFPIRVVREQLASAIQLIVQQTRLRDGSRKITSVSEITGMEGDRVVMAEMFRFVEQGVDKNGKVVGQTKATGLRPSFQPRLETAGIKLPNEMFMLQR